MRRIEDIENVHLPNLRGDYVFAVLGDIGYGRAVLARSEAGLVCAARRLIDSEGREYGRFVTEPQRIRIVSCSHGMQRSLSAEHAVVEAEQFEYAVRSAVVRYYDAFRALPRGFSRSDSDEAMYVGHDYGDDRSVCVEWTGGGTLRERFGSACCVHFTAPVGAKSIAPAAVGATMVMWLDKSEAPSVESFEDSTRSLMLSAAAFLFESIEALPEVRAAVRAEAKAVSARLKAEDDERRRGRDAAREKFLEGEREVLRLVFGDPQEAP